MLLNKWNFMVAEFASKEESPPTLKAVHVSDKGTCATNGHQLVRVTLPKAEQAQFPVIAGVTPANGELKPFLIDAASARDIAWAIPRKPRIPILANALVGEPDETSACIATAAQGNPKVFHPMLSQGRFPDVDAVIPKPEEKPVFEVAVNAALLARILKQVGEFADNNSHSCKLAFYGNDRAIRIMAERSETKQELMALLMPLRM